MGPKKKVLIVDNDPVMLRLLSEFMEREGYEVLSVDSPMKCLDLLVEERPDIIFTDLIMPGMGGDDLCRIIRNIERFKDCFLVIISAVAADQPLDYLEFGADGCIAKGPFQEMARHVKSLLLEAERPRRKPANTDIRGKETLHPRQITRELLARNQHLRIILESMSQGIIELAGQRIVYVNRKGGEILGMPYDHLIGTLLEQSLPSPLVEALGADADREAGPESVSVRFNDRQLVVEQFEVESGHATRIIILSDITERRKMEAVIEAANLTENLGYVFSGIRHEIGNPVNSIKMALSVVQRNLQQYDRETIAEFIDRSLQEISRLEYLLKTLKNYSLFETPVMSDFRISGFVTDFITLLRDDFARKNIQIQTIIPDEELMISADSRALHHVMLNLMTNAADALEECEVPRIMISAAEQGGMVAIKVDDNGKGISEAERKHLFKPFFTSKATGTGLGLVIVKKLMSAMSGTISVESYQGLGTTVTLALPRADHG